MRYATAQAFRTGLEARINDASIAGHSSIVPMRKMVVFERLLARLLITAPDRWVIKGGVALDLRLTGKARTTKDLDLARHDSEEDATEDLLNAIALDLGDHFVFSIERVNGLQEEAEIVSARYHVRAELAGRRFEEVILDIGFSDPFPRAPDLVAGPETLSFAGLGSIAIPALPLEQHLAEKVHAYSRIYRGGQLSFRPKDLVDIVLIQSIAAFGATSLQRAIDDTFSARATHPRPDRLQPPPADWRTPYRAMAMTVGLDPDVQVGFRMAARMLDPVLAASIDPTATWDPVVRTWTRSPRLE